MHAFKKFNHCIAIENDGKKIFYNSMDGYIFFKSFIGVIT